jgi:hypothetical protein
MTLLVTDHPAGAAFGVGSASADDTDGIGDANVAAVQPSGSDALGAVVVAR